MSSCPLCLQQETIHFHADKRREYKQCNHCKLVFVPIKFHLNSADEKAEYDKHENNPNDLGYQKFLSRLVMPLTKKLKPNAVGVDFGCGPGPTISPMLKHFGFTAENYDPYYFNQSELLDRQYDFITATEVIEHISNPQQSLKRLDDLLKCDGILAIMTKRVLSAEAFASWHYKNDPTHICFYSIDTFNWIAAQFNWRLEVIDKDVVFYHKESPLNVD